MTDKLKDVVTEYALDPVHELNILEQFDSFDLIAEEYEESAMKIVVTDEVQIAEMEAAKKGRLFLMKKRTAIENMRRELKKPYLDAGRAIDKIAKYLIEKIQPLEKHLLIQENFAKDRLNERLDELEERRAITIGYFDVDISNYDLRGMSDVAFDELFKRLKKEKEQSIIDRTIADQKAAQELKAEEERKAAEKAENQRIRDENEQLKKEAAEREAAEKEYPLQALCSICKQPFPVDDMIRSLDSMDLYCKTCDKQNFEIVDPPGESLDLVYVDEAAPLPPRVLSDTENIANELVNCLSLYFPTLSFNQKNAINADFQKIASGYRNFDVTRRALTNMSQSLSGEGCSYCKEIDKMIVAIVKPLGGWLG